MPELDRLASAVADLQLAVARADNDTARQASVGRAEDLRVLRLLDTWGPLKVSDIARRQSTSSATASARCDRLERKELVRRVRSDTDRRVVLVELTDSGAAIATDSVADRRATLGRVSDPVAIAAALEEVVAAYRAVDDHA